MSRGPFDPEFEHLPSEIPIFPLPGVLLLPGGRLPLNVFEPRYLAMVEDALAGPRAIGMVQPCETADDVGAARIYDTGCLGRITAFSETEDGRYLITLSGLIRFDVKAELPLRNGYRRITADYTRFRNDLDHDESDIDRGRLLQALGDYFDANGIEGDWDAIEDAEDEALVTSLAMICPFAAPEKQALLEAMTLPDRAEAMTAIMEMSAHDGGDEDQVSRH